MSDIQKHAEMTASNTRNFETKSTKKRMSYSWPMYWNRPLLYLFGVVLTTGLAIRADIKLYPLVNQSSPPNQSSLLTLLEYERIELGMELIEVQVLLGRGVEISSTETTATFIWRNPDSSSITATFKDGKLIEKSQDL